MGAGSDDLERGRAHLATLAEVGLATPRWPSRYGGIDATAEQGVIVARELTRFDIPDLYPFMVGIGLVGPVLMEFATPQQQARWIPAIGSGAEIWCQLFSEPDAGSDLANLGTRAEREPGSDIWRVSGQKVWSSRAHYSRWGLLLARMDPTVPKHAGITCFALDMGAPGVDVRPLRQMNGDTHFNEVFLNGAEIPDADRIGEIGTGWRIAVATLAHERGSLGEGWGGVTVTQLLELVRSCGRAQDPVFRQRVAKVISGMEVNRMSRLRSRATAKAGRPPGPEGSGAKLRGSQMFKELGNIALDAEGLSGIVGTIGQDEWQTLFLTGPSMSIRGGTDEIQRNIIAERVLGLPPEPRVDKNVAFSESRGRSA